jgi:MFS family permease
MVGAVVATLGAVLTIGFPSDRRAPRANGTDRRSTPLGILRRPGMRQALIGSIVILSAMDILVAFLPVYGEDRDIPPEVIGLAIGMMYFGQIPSRLVLDRLIVRFGYGRVLLASMAIPAVLVPAILLPIGGVVLIAVMGLIGVNLGVGQPITLLLVSLASAARDRGLAMSLRLVGNRVGQVTLPAVVGATAEQAGIAGIIVAVAVLLGAGAAAVRDGGPATDPPGA